MSFAAGLELFSLLRAGTLKVGEGIARDVFVLVFGFILISTPPFCVSRSKCHNSLFRKERRSHCLYGQYPC